MQQMGCNRVKAGFGMAMGLGSGKRGHRKPQGASVEVSPYLDTPQNEAPGAAPLRLATLASAPQRPSRTQLLSLTMGTPTPKHPQPPPPKTGQFMCSYSGHFILLLTLLIFIWLFFHFRDNLEG